MRDCVNRRFLNFVLAVKICPKLEINLSIRHEDYQRLFLDPLSKQQ